MKWHLTAACIALFLQTGRGEDSTAPLFEFDLTDGAFPEGIYFDNQNGVLPDQSAYKNGYTEKGWTVDRLDNRGYVAISPTYNGKGESCHNLLELPVAQIESGSVLSWEAKSVYRHFPEKYSVSVYPGEGGGPAQVLLNVENEDYTWTHHEIPLEDYAGRRVQIRFECSSDSGYLLALDRIEILCKGKADEPITDVEVSSDIVRGMMVDKATGMWCNNCPVADIRLDALREQLGERLVVLSTHQGDPLQNLPYWDELKWYSLPRMMLNRIPETAGDNIQKFQEYLDRPALFGISMDSPEVSDDRRISATVHVWSAEAVENVSDRYRVGYVLTGDFHDPENPLYRQKNNCAIPAYGAYYYLPSDIKAPLVYFDHVTLTSETAFTGIENSLPDAFNPSDSYDVELSAEIPELLEDTSAASLVAFVLDTETGEIMNVVQASPTNQSGIDRGDAQPRGNDTLTVDSFGNITTLLLPGESFELEVFAPDGRRLFSESGIAVGNDSFRLPPCGGIVIVRLASEAGIRMAKVNL